jgi:hypothetical protein
MQRVKTKQELAEALGCTIFLATVGYNKDFSRFCISFIHQDVARELG